MRQTQTQLVVRSQNLTPGCESQSYVNEKERLFEVLILERRKTHPWKAGAKHPGNRSAQNERVRKRESKAKHRK